MQYRAFREIADNEDLRCGGESGDVEHFSGWVAAIPADGGSTVYMPVVHWYPDCVIITLATSLVEEVPLRLAYVAITPPDLDDIFLARVDNPAQLQFIEADNALEAGDFLDLPGDNEKVN